MIKSISWLKLIFTQKTYQQLPGISMPWSDYTDQYYRHPDAKTIQTGSQKLPPETGVKPYVAVGSACRSAA